MNLKEGRYYKVKETVDGQKTPGGYFYIVRIYDDKVKVATADTPDQNELTGATFTLDRATAERFIEGPVTKVTRQ